ncbi:hypothetical protein GCM10022276_10450 [Sphingomonas limnosediminicola]|uniref:Uncharacterized protein n=1 Tax=Sphingomonas limnosediminicola TaxID=940133 RepID=A0ABP7L3C4_9SPHN
MGYDVAGLRRGRILDATRAPHKWGADSNRLNIVSTKKRPGMNPGPFFCDCFARPDARGWSVTDKSLGKEIARVKPAKQPTERKTFKSMLGCGSLK